MKSWVFTFSVEPPINETVSARFGSSVCFAAYSRWTGWRMILPGGYEEEIAEPQMIFLEEEYARTHRRDLTKKHLKTDNPLRLRRQKVEQLSLWS